MPRIFKEFRNGKSDVVTVASSNPIHYKNLSSFLLGFGGALNYYNYKGQVMMEGYLQAYRDGRTVIYEGEGQPPAIAHLIFFDSEEVVPAIVRALANKRPDLYFRYEFCDEDAQYAGELIIEGGYEHGELYEPRGEDTIVLFHEIWGRYDAFVKDEKTGRYIPADETERQLEME